MDEKHEDIEALKTLPDETRRALDAFIRLSAVGTSQKRIRERLADSVVLKLSAGPKRPQ